LKAPKLRGNLGELFLENLLKQILPTSLFKTQYRFKDGQRVDAIVHLGDRILPIDSKFPIESYDEIDDPKSPGYKSFVSRLKKYIDDISGKYIRPSENTTEIALMYIPAEAVYTAFIASEDTSLFEYSLSKKVIPSSPGHLYGFLASISTLYLENQLAGNSKNLSGVISEISESLGKLNNLNERMNGSLRSASSSNEKSKAEIIKIENQLEKLKEPDEIEELD
jgi:DNA recombination protein RmuC